MDRLTLGDVRHVRLAEDHRVIAQIHVAARLRPHAGQRLQESGLAGAALSDQSHELAGRHAERGRVQDRPAGDLHADINGAETDVRAVVDDRDPSAVVDEPKECQQLSPGPEPLIHCVRVTARVLS